MKVRVTSVSREAESLSTAPAAIFVISGDDIRRGGFSSVPDALRLVPGLYVAQQSAHIWIIAARGFANAFNTKMLVLIDGRTVYTPTFGGVYWDVQDPPIEDIDRIEVIRGPGGTQWGANAVNGVINIVTKDAAKTQGALLAASSGVNEGAGGRVRYGGKVGDSFAYRVFGTSNYWLPTAASNGGNSYDAWTISQGGARFDWNVSAKDKLTFDGRGYSGLVRDLTAVLTPTSPATALVNFNTLLNGGHLLGQWKRTVSDRSSIQVLGYCDWTERIGSSPDYRTICDAEFQHTHSFDARQTLIWGGSVQTTGDDFAGTFTVNVVPARRRDTRYEGFLQYDVALVPNRLRLIAGSKFEHNDYTGFEYQPQIRAVWTPAKNQTVWAAASRAVRTPAETDSYIREIPSQINPMPPPLTFFLVEGNPDLKSEVLHATELGYRYEWSKRFSLDGAIYYNRYYDLLALGPTGAPTINLSPFYVEVPAQIINAGEGQTHGLELSLQYAPIHRWTLTTGITELRGNDSAGYPAVAANPRHQVTVQSRLDATRWINLDAYYFYYDATAQGVPTLNRVDLGLSTKPLHGFTLSLWGRNLQQDRHTEEQPPGGPVTEIRRSLVFKLLWESRPE
jgi:iron complex outermembrane receptor protein